MTSNFSRMISPDVQGQASNCLRFKAHVLIVGGATKTVFSLVPQGTPDAVKISPFEKMPIDPELANLIRRKN